MYTFSRMHREANLELWSINDSNSFKNNTHLFIWEDNENICTLVITTLDQNIFKDEDNGLSTQIDSLTSDLVNTKSQKFYFERIIVDERKLVDNEENPIETQMVSFYINEVWNLTLDVAKKYGIELDEIDNTKNFKY